MSSEQKRFPQSLPWRLSPEEVARFVGDCTVPRAGAMVSGADLYSAYVAWCERLGFVPETATAFGRSMNRVLQKAKRSSIWYLDIDLKGAAE